MLSYNEVLKYFEYLRKGGEAYMKEKNGFDENDSFWSLDSMLPPKRNNENPMYQTKASDVSVSEIEIAGEPKPAGEPIPRLKYPLETPSKRRPLTHRRPL